MAVQLGQDSCNESEDTFSDIIQKDNDNEAENESFDKDASDEFDLSERPKRLKLKPSKAQQKADTKPIQTNITKKDLDDDNDDDDGISIQTEVLSDYLKPTNILSKYQNGPRNAEQEEYEEEEEKEWPTTQEELEFNHVTEAFDEQPYINDADDMHPMQQQQEEEKSDFDPIAFEDLYSCLTEQANQEIDSHDIIIEDFRNVNWFTFMKMFIFGGCAVALKTVALNEERDSIFKIAKLKLDVTNIMHHRCLITLWMKITDDARQCDKTGSHWQQIGFQGNDPSTDIRGAGLLGILQLIFICEHYTDILSKIYLLSINDHQNFPLVIVSFTITGIVIQLLRSCVIYQYINKNQSVIDAVNQIYTALFYEFYLNWKNKSRTIIDFDEAQKELQQQAFTNWQKLLHQLQQREDEHNQYTQQDQSRQKLLVSDSNDEEIEFGKSKIADSGKNQQSDKERKAKYQV